MRSARADKYREEAARLRREAEDMKHSENRQQLLDIAAQYDRLADSAKPMLPSELIAAVERCIEVAGAN
jgi:hypothetical protein